MATAVDTDPSLQAKRTIFPIRPVEPLGARWIALILIGHGIYGLLLVRSPALATLHAVMTFAVGLWVSLTSTMKRVALICAYMAGSEVLWRLGKAAIPWEFVKYGIAILALLALGRVRRLRWDWLSVTYFALLIPLSLMSFFEQNFAFARQQVSFNLSGPLTLAVTTWFFSNLRPSRAEVQRLFIATLAPVFSLAIIALTRTASIDDLSFSDALNFQTSGGFGPNQVSLALGFGALLAILMAILLEENVRARAVLGLAALFLGAQSALTFSRGGLYSTIGAVIIALPFLLHGSRNRVMLIVSAVVLVLAADLFVLPRIDAMTGGALATRFQDTDPTGRDQLVMLELETFVAHPFLGTGPAAFDEAGFGVMSVHTEFSRLPAEHGIFGVAALLAMLLLAWRDVSSQRSAAARALTIALLAWAMLSMTHAAMRIAVVPFAFGMAACLFMARGEGPELARTPLIRNFSA